MLKLFNGGDGFLLIAELNFFCGNCDIENVLLILRVLLLIFKLWAGLRLPMWCLFLEDFNRMVMRLRWNALHWWSRRRERLLGTPWGVDQERAYVSSRRNKLIAFFAANLLVSHLHWKGEWVDRLTHYRRLNAFFSSLPQSHLFSPQLWLHQEPAPHRRVLSCWIADRTFTFILCLFLHGLSFNHGLLGRVYFYWLDKAANSVVDRRLAVCGPEVLVLMGFPEGKIISLFLKILHHLLESGLFDGESLAFLPGVFDYRSIDPTWLVFRHAHVKFPFLVNLSLQHQCVDVYQVFTHISMLERLVVLRMRVSFLTDRSSGAVGNVLVLALPVVGFLKLNELAFWWGALEAEVASVVAVQEKLAALADLHLLVLSACLAFFSASLTIVYQICLFRKLGVFCQSIRLLLTIVSFYTNSHFFVRFHILDHVKYFVLPMSNRELFIWTLVLLRTLVFWNSF